METGTETEKKTTDNAPIVTRTLVELEVENKSLLEKNDLLTKDLATTKARNSELEDQVADLEVEALVGIRITPAQKSAFVKARKLDRSLYDEMVSACPTDMGLMRQIVPGGDGGIQTRLSSTETDAFEVAAKAK